MLRTSASASDAALLRCLCKNPQPVNRDCTLEFRLPVAALVQALEYACGQPVAVRLAAGTNDLVGSAVGQRAGASDAPDTFSMRFAADLAGSGKADQPVRLEVGLSVSGDAKASRLACTVSIEGAKADGPAVEAMLGQFVADALAAADRASSAIRGSFGSWLAGLFWSGRTYWFLCSLVVAAALILAVRSRL